MKFDPRRVTVVKLTIVSVSLVLSLGFAIWNGSQKVEAYSSGPPPSYTGGRGESDCTECHVGAQVNGNPAGSVQITGAPHDYLPGKPYTVSVTTAQDDPFPTLFGFEMMVIDESGRQAGTLSYPSMPTPELQLRLGNVDGNNRYYIEHTSAGTTAPGFATSRTWVFTWTAPAQRVGKISFYAAGNAANGNGSDSGDYIYTNSRASLTGTATSNFDGDAASDIAVFKPSTGLWTSYSIANNTNQTFALGGRGDRLVPGDYDGDGTTDYAVFRPSNSNWYIQRSTAGFIQTAFGNAGDIPVPGDYDGDGKADLAVFRPSNNTWYLNQTTAGSTSVVWGQSGDKLTPADYDGDAKTDIAVFRPSSATWFIKKSLTGDAQIQYGASGDKPVQADYDGDGKVDIAVFHPSTAAWNLLRSTDGAISIIFGAGTDIPVPGDYDGDGKADIAGFIPSRNGSNWHILRSSDAGIYNKALGVLRDLPVAASYLGQ